ncbi:MAG: type IV pilin [Candidatus Diapherotrites archaeon]|nr:type IV pilin [Candidatus Diapherotrites archaeon]
MKGVSPVIATVLMVAVAIAAAVVFYSWIMSTTASTTTQASAKAGEIGKYSLVIESAECNAEGNYVRIYMRNESDVKVDANFTYIIQSSSGAVLDTNTIPVTIDAKQVKSIDLNKTYGVTTLPSNQRITVILRGPSGIAVSTDQPITCT